MIFRLTTAIRCPGRCTAGWAAPTKLRAAINEIPALDPASAAELTEHIALLKRWFFRSSRMGELFLTDEKGELPMRRLVRGVSRVFRGEKESESTIA